MRLSRTFRREIGMDREIRMDKEKKDIFDKLMSLPVLNIFEGFYKKHKEVLLYLFFGGLAFVVSIATYAGFNVALEINELVANVLSWIITVLFAFFTNRIWVFQAPTDGAIIFWRQLGAFYAGRVLTLIVEELILLTFITLLKFPGMAVKVAAQVVVIILNYIVSKLLVFKKKS